MTTDKEIRARIAAALQHEDFLDRAEAEEAAFHMTDWLDDLRALVDWFANPAAAPDAAVQDLLISFLCHAPAHLCAASRIVCGDPVTDVFEIGAVLGDGVGTRKAGDRYPK